MINYLKALSNEKRLKIIYALTINDFCQVHIEEITNISQIDVSRNAKILLENNIINSVKKKNRVIYSLNKDFENKYKNLIDDITNEYSYLTEDLDESEIKKRCDHYEK